MGLNACGTLHTSLVGHDPDVLQVLFEYLQCDWSPQTNQRLEHTALHTYCINLYRCSMHA